MELKTKGSGEEQIPFRKNTFDVGYWNVRYVFQCCN